MPLQVLVHYRRKLSLFFLGSGVPNSIACEKPRRHDEADTFIPIWLRECGSLRLILLSRIRGAAT